MGISGHMLGEKKLRQLSKETGLPLDRAYRRNREVQGRVIDADGTCTHYDISRVDQGVLQYVRIEDPLHWSSCPRPS